MWRIFRRNRIAPTLTDGVETGPGARSDGRYVFTPGQRLRSAVTGNSWRIADYLGAGGYGSVYLAEDEKRRPFAIKTLNAHFFQQPSRWYVQEREAAIWVLLDRHPNIVSAHWCERIEDHFCLVLEYLSGGTLGQQLLKGPLQPALAVRYGLAMCDAMAYAHEKLGLVHRDINPANCLLDAAGTLKLTDFGIAWRRDSQRSGEGPGSGGTPGYRAPEQFDASDFVDTRADIYSFGVTLYQMLTACTVRTADGRPNLFLAEQAAADRRLRRVSTDLQELIVQCLQTDRDRRPSNFPSLRGRLGAAFRHLANAPSPPPPRIAPLRIDELQNKGIALQILGWYEPALECYERALHLSPRDAELWLGNSAVLHLMGRHDEAIAAADRGLVLDRRVGDLWNNRGIALLESGRPLEATESFSRALDCDSTDPVFWRNQGAAFSRLGRLRAAIEAYDNGLARDRNDTRLFQFKAQALLDLGRLEDAVRCLRDGLEISPQHAGLQHGLGVALHRLGKLDDALTALNGALRVLPGDVGISRSKLAVLMDLANWAPARALVDVLLLAAPEDQALRKSRVSILWRLGMSADATSLLQLMYGETAKDEAQQADLRALAAGLGMPVGPSTCGK